MAALFRTLSRSLGEPAAAGSRVRHRLRLRLAGSAAAWLAALALTLLLAPYLQRANFAVFWVAVIFTAWYAGLGAALVSAVASVVAVNYFLIPPVHSVRVPGAADVLTLAIFTGAAATVSALAAGRADAKRSAEGYARQLEEQAAELQQQTESAQSLAEELEETVQQLEETRLAAEESRDQAEVERERLRTVLDSLPEATTVYDHDWRWTYINPVAGQLLRDTGRDAEALIGRRVWDEFPEAGETPFRVNLTRAVAEGRIVEYEERRADGRWYENRVIPMRGGVVTYARDVSATRQADLALRESEERFRRLFVANPLPMWAFDVETLEFLDVNDAALARYGYTRAEFLGLTLTDIHPHQDAPRVIECVAEDGRDEIMYRGTFRHLTRDGALVEAEVSTQEVVLGGRRARLALALDVTERNRAVARERYLAEASRVLGSSLDYESTLRHVAQFAVPSLADWCAIDLVADDGSLEQMAVVHTDPARVATARELRRRYPSPPDSPSGIHAVVRTGRSEFYPVVTDALLDTVAQDAAHLGLLRALQFSSIIIAPLLGQIGVRGAITLVFAESGRRYTEGDRALAEEIGRRAAFAIDNARLYAAEQQARQRAEAAATRTARLQAVTAALSATLTPAQVAQVVIEHGVAALGAQAAAVAELDESASTLVMLGAVGYPAEAVARFRHLPLDAHFPLAEAVRSGEPIILATDTERDARYPNLAELRRANGAGAMAAIPLAVEGRHVGVLGINFPEQLVLGDEDRRFVLALAQQCAQALDRARLYEAEQRAREEAQLQREQAEAANRAKGEFLAVMSHELRTPLNAIAGYVELLELGIRGPVTDAQREDLQRIRRSQRHLLALVNDVLNFVRLDAGQVRYEIDDVPLAALLADVGTLVGPQLAAKQLRFEVRDAPPGHGDRDRALAVRADRDKVAQILLNLLSNAIKFTPVGGRITLSCDLAADAATVLLRVADDGIGIPADHLAVIFEPFVQVQRGLTRTTEGTGLGLAISRDLARAMGGELQVESTLGGGSVFTLLLPAAA